PEEHQTMWCDALMEVTRRCGAAGWLNWPYADSPDPKADISAGSGLWTGDTTRLKHWGRRFVELAAELKKAAPTWTEPRRVIELDMAEYLYEHDGAPAHAMLRQIVADGLDGGVAVKWK
ncbi:MAG: hypothetical protein IT441_03875, partial [Phycisphaeraceae bacterium]|nr:hypothetical protein [Phycisphaeraceae bacterium]